jgi:GT2 family glycosyltransferase
VDWATGCALFLAAPTFRRLGPIDEGYFLYLEDTDWCLRAARLGVETWLIPGAVIRHEVSASVRALPRAAVRYYAYRNQYRLEFRHGPAWLRPLVLLDALWTLAKAAARWLLFPSYRADAYYHARTRGVLDFLRGRWGPAPALGTGA